MKKLPSKITILGRNYRITEVSMQKMQQTTETPSMGAVDWSTRRILIIKDMTNEDKLLTLAHEIVHIGMNTAGLDQVTNRKIQEIICETMANSFMDLIKGLSK